MHKKKKILIVDNETIVGECISEIVEMNNFRASYVSNGKDAYNLFKTEYFDIIITDYSMMGVDGVKLTEVARSKYPQALIIGISSDFKRNDFLAAGADIFLRKPFSAAELIATIARINLMP